MTAEDFVCLRREAAKPVLRRLRHDRHRAPARLEPLLKQVEERLFDHDFDYESVKRKLGIKDGRLSGVFRRALGRPPATYVREARMETAATLLRDSDLKVAVVGNLVGYLSPQSFTRAFTMWAETTPLRYRHAHEMARLEDERQQRARAAAPPTPPTPTFRPRRLQRARLGGGGSRRLSPVPLGSSAQGPVLSPGRADRVRAEVLWERLGDVPPGRQCEYLRDQVHVWSESFFSLLFEKSRVTSRDDRKEAIRIAELSLAYTLVRRPCPFAGSPWNEREARAWAYVGNAKRLDYDWSGAESAFLQAHAALGQEKDSPPAVLGEVLNHEVAFRRYQRRLERAIALSAQAVEVLEGTQATDLLLAALLQRGDLLNIAEAHEVALQTLRRAADIAAAENRRFLLFAARYSIAVTHLEAGQVDAASSLLSGFSELPTDGLHPRHTIMVRALAGRIAGAKGNNADAEVMLASAVDALLRRDDSEYAAVLSLELAAVLTRRNKVQAVLDVLTPVAPFLQQLGYWDEAASAVSLLRAALARRSVSLETIERVQQALR